MARGAGSVDEVTSEPMAADSSAPSDGAPTGAQRVRYRCAACGNLTRFDVVTMRRTNAFHHYSVGGELTIEDEEVLDEDVEKVSCRWCGNGNSIEVLDVGSPGPPGSPGPS